MAEIEVRGYAPELRARWDSFLDRAKNGTFLFRRGYMEYHADRFEDASLLFVRGSELVALLPAHRDGDTLRSHGGLSYGGLVCDARMSASMILRVFEALLDHLRAGGVERLVYKPVPRIYHAFPAEEDLYALFRVGATLVRRDVSSTIEMANRYPLRKGRRSAVKKSQRQPIALSESRDFESFMEMDAQLLGAKYGVAPVHSAAEMRLLADRFPEEIRLFAAHRRGGGELLCGAIVYETPLVAHVQYIASTESGRELSALDRLFAWLLDEVYAEKRYFDFGISTEDQGRTLNHDLIRNKESWGARATVCDQYELGL